MYNWLIIKVSNYKKGHGEIILIFHAATLKINAQSFTCIWVFLIWQDFVWQADQGPRKKEPNNGLFRVWFPKLGFKIITIWLWYFIMLWDATITVELLWDATITGLRWIEYMNNLTHSRSEYFSPPADIRKVHKAQSFKTDSNHQASTAKAAIFRDPKCLLAYWWQSENHTLCHSLTLHPEIINSLYPCVIVQLTDLPNWQLQFRPHIWKLTHT